MKFEEVTKKDFSKLIENYVREKGGSYLDAIIIQCEEFDIEPALIAKYLNKPIVEKLRIEGEDINLIPRIKSKLPI